MDRTPGGRHPGRDVAWRRGTMNAELSPVNPLLTPLLPAPPVRPVTTLFLKPVYDITVRRNTLAVSVRAHLEAPREPRPAACG